MTCWSGEHYYVSFIDNYTHFTVVHPIKEKSDTFGMFKRFEALTNAHFCFKISKLRYDNDGK